jgi:pimeloyl-ACP methyl ester carboxylesterase
MLKKIFVPGWMDTADNHVDYSGLEIWKKKINHNDKIEVEYVVGHSLGAGYALLNWEKNRNTKLILVNPSLPQTGFPDFFIRWIKFLLSEGTSMRRKRLKCFLHLYLGIKQGLELIFKDYEKIIDLIPVKDIVFIRGKEDKFFFDEKMAENIRLKGKRVIEINGARHGWSEKFSEEINKLIK